MTALFIIYFVFTRCLRREPVRILREESRGDWQIVEIRQKETGHRRN